MSSDVTSNSIRLDYVVFCPPRQVRGSILLTAVATARVQDYVQCKYVANWIVCVVQFLCQ